MIQISAHHRGLCASSCCISTRWRHTIPNMEYRTFTGNLAQAGSTIREFAELLGMNKNSVSNYAQSGKVPTHLGVISQLIAVMREQGLDYRAALQGMKISRKTSRGKPFGGRGSTISRHSLALEPAPISAIKPQGSGDQTALQGVPQKPRFWYPGDLRTPEESVPVAQALSTNGVQQQSSKPIPVRYKGRKIRV